MLRITAIRLRPHQDLLVELENYVRQNRIEAACVLTCVGSLRRAAIRFADQPDAALLQGGDPAARFEIVSLTGVMSRNGSHYHLSVSDGEGRTFGGHLMEGCRVYTTCEIVIGILDGMVFQREFDPESGYPELVILEKDEKENHP